MIRRATGVTLLLAALALPAVPAGAEPMPTVQRCTAAEREAHPEAGGCSYEHRRDGRGLRPHPGKRDHTPGPPDSTEKPGNGPKPGRGPNRR